MSHGQQLEQSHQQTHMLSTKQIEGLEILTMGAVELNSFLTEEQLSNPILELESSMQPIDSASASSGQTDDEKAYYDIPDRHEMQLDEYLVSQLPQQELPKDKLLLLVKVIGLIDEKTGYFSDSIEWMCEQLERSKEEISWAVDYIRGLEPAGVGAYDLTDCLCLQLERMGKLDDTIGQLVREHLEDIAKGNISAISRKLHISTKRVKDYIALVQQLNPRPASSFGIEDAAYIVPDVRADYSENEWQISLLGIRSDTIRVNSGYIKMAKEATAPKVIAYFSEKINRAQQLMAAMKQRGDTLKTMFGYVLTIQKEYALGLGARRMLTQKEVADALGVHSSTIHRAVKNKYIDLPAGVLPVSELFTAKKDRPDETEGMKQVAKNKQVRHVSELEAGKQVSSICLIAPTEALIKQNDSVCARFGKRVDAFLASVPDACQVARDLSNRGAEILISRKGTRRMLEEEGHTTVEIGLSLSDYIPVMEKASKIQGTVAFFSYGPIAEDIRSMSYLLGIDARYYSFRYMAQCREVVRKAMEDGAVLGIGGADSAVAADELGLEHLTVENSEQSLLSAIQAAEQLLQLKREEAKKAEELKIKLERYDLVFGFTHDAIIAVNAEGNVDVVNREAEKILKADGQSCIGQPIRKVLPHSGIPKMLSSGQKELNQLMTINGTMVSTNRVPIIVDGKIRGAVATFQGIKAIQTSEKKIRIKLSEKGLTAKYHFSDIIGNSPQMLDLIRMAKKFARANATILIHGETGVGRELFAQSIHNESLRADGPFVAVNCGSLPKNILEAELFGYAEGAFTGASKGGKIGLFEMAHGGTIFLDEIGEMPLETQVQLLRVLQEKEIRRLGSDRVTPIDIRVITATNRDLPTEIAEKRFREDLYYRLNVLNLEIPPLRERVGDAELIGLHIYQSFMPCSEAELTQLRGVFGQLRGYAWPGNAREVHNLMERIYVLRSQNESFAFVSEYIKGFLRQQQKTEKSRKQTVIQEAPAASRNDDLEAWERDRISETLREHHLEMAKTAEAHCGEK